MSEKPFEIVDKEHRRSPLKQNAPTRCEHKRAYTSDKYPASGTRYICVACGFGSTFPRDLK